MGHYEDQLYHVARPAENRQQKRRIRLDDWEALYLQRPLIEYASYHANTEDDEAIALAYADYIDMRIRDAGANFCYLYAHSIEAEGVLVDVAMRADGPCRGHIFDTVVEQLDNYSR